MQHRVVRYGILLVAGFFSLTACVGGTNMSGQESSPELAKDSKPTATPMTVPPTPVFEVSLPDLGPAPNINNEIWLNSDSPLSLDSIAGKVVLLEFWTFG